MRRASSILGSALFLVIAPGAVAGLGPWWISHWRAGTGETWWIPMQILGDLIALGVLVLFDSFTRFAIKGLGTPAPVFPTRSLVVTGLYRHVRNPMYIAVVAVIFGQGLTFANLRLIAYGAAVWVFFHLFVVAYEEPTLRSTFGAEYEAFCRGVSRRIPRLTPY